VKLPCHKIFSRWSYN